MAILLALASSELEVAGITTVAGNVPLRLTTRNALMMCELAGRPDIPVHPGADRPLRRKLITAEEVHGPTGIDGAHLPEPTIEPAAQPAADFITETIMGSPEGTVTLCPLGPLTNVALAFREEPRLAQRVREIVLMGGAFLEGGNTTPVAEFNIYVDPDAADLVFRSGAPIVMMPLDVTHRVLASSERLSRIRALGTPAADAVAGMLEFYERHDRERYGMEGAPLHDPCVIAYLIEPGLFSGRACHVRIETESDLTLGMTVVDWWDITRLAPTALVMREVNAAAFFDLIVDRIARLPPDTPQP